MKSKFRLDGTCKVCGKNYGKHYNGICPQPTSLDEKASLHTEIADLKAQLAEAQNALLLASAENDKFRGQLAASEAAMEKLRATVKELVQAMRDYEMDVDVPPPYKHLDMIARAKVALSGQKEQV